MAAQKRQWNKALFRPSTEIRLEPGISGLCFGRQKKVEMKGTFSEHNYTPNMLELVYLFILYYRMIISLFFFFYLFFFNFLLAWRNLIEYFIFYINNILKTCFSSMLYFLNFI